MRALSSAFASPFSQHMAAGLGKTIDIDFTQSASPLRAIPYDTGDTYQFTRASTVWCPAYDTATAALKWAEIPANVPPMPGMRWDAVNSLWSPYDTNGVLIPADFRKGYWYLPQATNSLDDSRTFDGVGWITSGALTLAKNKPGFDGVANSATIITDTDSTQTSFITASKTIPNDSNTHCVLMLIGKDNDDTRFPMARAAVSGGTTGGVVNYKVNTKTGAVSQVSNSASGSFTVTSFDDDFWLAELYIPNNATGNTTLSVNLYPAGDDTFSTGDGNAATTGSIVVDQVEIRLNTSFYDGSPIVTNGSALTRLASDYRISINNHSDSAGMILCDLEAGLGTAQMIAGDSPIVSLRPQIQNILSQYLYLFTSRDSSGGSASTTGAMLNSWSKGDGLKVAAHWSSDQLEVVLNGKAASGNYGGSFSKSGEDILLFYLQKFPWYLRSFRYYKVDRGTAWIQGQQA